MKRQLHKRMAGHIVWQIIGEFADGTIDARRAAQWLEISRSRLYALKERWRATPAEAADAGWLYRRSNAAPRHLPLDVQGFIQEELSYIRQQSPFFRGHMNFARLAEQCHKRFGRRFQRNTLRRWAIDHGLYDPKVDTTAKAYVRFEMGAIGMLFQHDSSPHVWVPHTKRHDALILTIDDHSRKVVGARLVPHDTSWNHLCVVRETLETHGCPLAYYTDNHRIFQPSTEPHVQFARALESLGIALKLTGKAQPQAKGKVEKRFDYFQRRIPYDCERYNVKNLTEANKILRDQVDYYNEYHVHDETKERPNHRWKKALDEGRHCLKPLPEKAPLDLIFALHFKRMIRKDGTFQFKGQHWQIPDAPRFGEVTVVLHPQTSWRRPFTELYVLHKGSTIAHFVVPKNQGLTPP